MAATTSLVGRPVMIQMNDFVDEPTCGCIRFVDVATKSVAIELEVSLERGDARYEWAVASARLARDDLDTLVSAKSLGCGVTWISSFRFRQSDPFDLSWWRGGAAAIADIVLMR